jgi:hypothetical protein
MAKGRSTIGFNPLDAVVPQRSAAVAETPPEPVVARRAVTARLRADLVDEAQDAVYWTPGLTFTALIEDGLVARLEELKKENGAPFKRRAGAIKTGRRPG